MEACGIGLASRRVCAGVVRNDVTNRVPRPDLPDKTPHCLKLCFGEWIRAIIQVHEFDTDRKVIHAAPAIRHT